MLPRLQRTRVHLTLVMLHDTERMFLVCFFLP